MENLREYEPLNYLIELMPKKAQRGLTSLNVDWLSMDVNTDFIAIGVNFGMVFLHNRKDRKMTKIRCQDKSGKITALKMLKVLDHQVAIGTSTGSVELHLIPLPGRPQQMKMFPFNAHKSQITCMEWSPNGMKLYSGDNQGVIVCAQVDFYEGNCSTVVILKESEPVVQLSYAYKCLLVSTWGRTVIFESDSRSIKQVGQQPRKCKGTFGASFIPAVCKARDAKFYLSRPGLRLWRSDIDGTVENTLLFNELIKIGYPQLSLLEGTPSLIQDGHSEIQFGPVIIYKESLVLSWSYSSLFILDPINMKVISGCSGSLGSIMDVSVVGDEIFILTRGAGRPIVRLACSPESIYSRPSEHTQFTREELRLLKDQNEARISKLESQHEVSTNPEQKPNIVSKFLIKAADEIVSGAKMTKMNIEKLEQKLKSSPKQSPTPERKASLSETDGKVEPDAVPTTPAASLSAEVLASQFKEAGGNQEDHVDTQEEPVTNGVISSDIQETLLKNDNSGIKPKVDTTTTFKDIGKESFEDELVFSKQKKPKKKGKKKKGKGKPNDDFISVPETLPSLTSTDTNLPSFEILDNYAHTDGDVLLETLSTSGVHDNLQSMLKKDCESSTTGVIKEAVSSEENPPQHNGGDQSDINGHSETQNNFGCVKNDLSKDDDNTFLNVSTLSSKQTIGSCDNVLNIFATKHSPDPNNLGSNSCNESVTSADDPRSLTSCKDDNLAPIEDGGGISDTDLKDQPQTEKDISIYDRPNTLGKNKSLEHEPDQISTSSHESLEAEMSSDDFNLPEGIQQKVAGSWVHCNSPGVITQLIVSDRHVWCVDNHDRVHFTLINSGKYKWNKLRDSAQQMAVSHTESIVWRVHRKSGKAYACAPITPRSPIGSKWAETCHDVCYVALDETIAWIIKTNHDVYVQQDLSRDRVYSRNVRVSSSSQIKLDQVATSRGVVWGRVTDGNMVYRNGITDNKRTGTEWLPFDGQSIQVVSMAIDSRNTGWVIDQDGNVWMKTGVTMETPQGDSKNWWQVPMSEYLMQDRSTFSALFENTITMVGKQIFKAYHQSRPMFIGASSAGVWVAGSGHVKSSLYASKGNLIGSYWNMASPHGLSQSAQWLCISASGAYGTSGMIWALQKSGEVFCFPSDTLRPCLIEPPVGQDNLKYLSSSAEGLWAIGESNSVYVRDGMSPRHPQGLRWKTLNLSQLGPSKVIHLTCGSIGVWACDSDGNIHFRLGLCMPRNDSMVPAWVQVDGKPTGSGNYFTNVYVGPGDNIVWALDNKRNVYARWGISNRLPIGLRWEIVQGTPANLLCVSSESVWALCPNGDVFRRHGITEKNSLGDYWKKVPGNFSLLSVSQNDELWAIDNEGHIFQQLVKMFSRGGEHLQRTTAIIEEDDWDVI
ncbi:tectonin beta-propeller repeat-containing protein 2-like isoform X1 [Anneissia japonica]|uniref:tectonin beta-propeller repeat-containing protein 2-like isoform X1 n=1 Tax=Anneissia japonica TaxID=1529436 RepID=UPI0014254B48|nr:tectonin beta-propeller repeat-containing protein 2-like isoform X1 [Anneissia japonica]XP_033105346.1 tectonin beta-propeller repeat-containing protein 2-like isoform X1 [Anneissia japonica]XP_033105347.1 tectonin beta-propeller repeat-containing protein 2-like isoform X1 [Anneissia japonica]